MKVLGRSWRRRRADGTRTVAAWLVLAALALHALIPAGWMPNTSGEGHAPLVICTASGAQMTDPGGPQPAPARHRADRHDLCAFAGVGAAPAAAGLAFAAPAFDLQPALTSLHVRRFADDSRGHREQAARAPPIDV